MNRQDWNGGIGYRKGRNPGLKLSGNPILITSGVSGIGLAVAERFLKEGNKVIIAGRRRNI